MQTETPLSRLRSFLNSDLVDQMEELSSIQTIPEGTEILREGQYIKVIPIVLDGLIRVYTRHEDKELLLYYIKPDESCIMSFVAAMKNEPSKVYAVTEDETTAVLLPVDSVNRWTKTFPDMNTLFFRLFNDRYTELLDTIHHVIFNKLDTRVYEYLKEKVQLTHRNPLKISHRQIASELGTAREVVSRVMKKLEKENKLKQHPNSIEILEW